MPTNHDPADSLIQRATSSRVPGIDASTDVARSMPSQTEATPDTPEEVEPSEVELFETQDLFLGMEAPGPNFVFLHVYAHGSSGFRILGKNSRVVDLDTERNDRPRLQMTDDLALGDMVRSEMGPTVETPGAIWEYMSEFSYSNEELRLWLKSLEQLFGATLHVVITDYTRYEIPWEMVELAPKEYLGALFVVSRWTRTKTWQGDDVPFEVRSDACEGHVVSYVNHEELEGTGPELEFLGELNAVDFDDMLEFRTHLQEPVSGIGLVYMGCHGILQDQQGAVAIGSIANASQRLTFARLRRLPLRLLKHSQSIVFINACHTGRLQANVKYFSDSHHRRGFAEVFLMHGARGVIGTLGAVDAYFAPVFAQRILNETQLLPEQSVASILRRLRSEIVDSLSDDPDDVELFSFINTFMYVYYGDPTTVLQLNRREGYDR